MPIKDKNLYREYQRNYKKSHYQEYKDKLLSQGPEAIEQLYKLTRGYARKHKLKLRETVFSHYGNSCACCGETEPAFLTIDHILNDGKLDRGNSERGGHGLYRKIIREEFPNTYQILCWNCNCGKHKNNGICPHKVAK